MKNSFIFLLVFGLTLNISAVLAEDTNSTETSRQRDERMKWWRQARFGMFIHWGPVSIKGTEISWSRGGSRKGGGEGGLGSNVMPEEEYDNLYKQFNPVKFDADFWAQIAAGAGVKYIVFVAKHWDGFCEWPTKTTEYNVSNTPFKRDICGELAKAARKAGLRIGWYFCPADLHDPDCNTSRHADYLVRMRGQLSELLTHYGRIDLLWFDYAGHNDAPWDQTNTYRLVRSLQPNLIINNRLDMKSMSDYWAQKVSKDADYYTPEQFVGAFDNKTPWETCMTLGTQWSWKPNDNIKSLKECIDILVKCAGGDGNLLLNVGPMPDGRIEPRQAERLLEIGKWLEKNGESIYETRGGPFKPGKWGASTHKNNRIYLHILNWHDKETLTFPDINKKILKSSLLAGGAVKIEKTEEGINVTVPKQYQDSLDTIVVLEIDSDAGDIEPIDVIFHSGSLAANKKAGASNVFENQAGHNADKAFDDDFDTRWATDFGVSRAWLEVDLGENQKFNKVMIDEAYAGRVQSFELRYRDGQEWKTFYKGDKIGEGFDAEFEPVTARYVRLYIIEAAEGPTINEFQIFAEKRKGKL
jgi:alpha-L-fucosidase